MRNRIAWTLLGLVALAAAGCSDDAPPLRTPRPTHTAAAEPTPSPTVAPPDLTIAQPADGATVEEFSFTVEVEISPSDFDPGSVSASLNGDSLTLLGGPERFTATVEPGPPLLDENLLDVTAMTRLGQSVQRHSRFAYLPPKARARRIADDTDLIGGPLAHGRAGDYLLVNRVARFIVQDVAQRDLYSVGQFGGNIIDAELVDRPGLDNFLEIQPGLNLETVINAQTAEIVNDGQDGTAAIVRTCGPDDTLDFVNPSTIIEGAGLEFPASADDVDYEIEACTEYRLAPGKSYVEMETTVFNNEDTVVRLFVGDYLNASGEVDQWTSSGAGIGEILTSTLGVMSYIGFGEATGVDYSHTTLPIPGSRFQTSSFFTAAGVANVLQSGSVLDAILGGPPPFVVPAGGSKSYTRYFGVGDGSGGNAVDIENEVKGIPHGRLRGCVTIAGASAPGARVSVGPQSAGAIQGLATQFVTGADGCYAGTVPLGTYGVAAARHGVPLERNGTSPLVHEVTIEEGVETVQDIDLPATGRLRVTVVDHGGAPLPARVSVVGFDPDPEPRLLLSGPQGTDVTGLFHDLTTDPEPFGIVRIAYAGADGVAELEIEPASYEIYVSRGTEYSAFHAPASIAAGKTSSIAAQIARVVDTGGFVSSDFHVHGINSADSRISHRSRVLQFAGEGVDNVIMTDHHAHTDLTPVIADLGLSAFLRATVGEEITTWDYGHFNAYPLLVDPNRPSGGSTDWAGAAPPGRDFPEHGSYSLTPAAIAALATTGPSSTPDSVIQINHIDSHFRPLRIDTSQVPPVSAIGAEDKRRYRLDPTAGNLFHHFPALELWNGSNRDAQRKFLVERIGIWFNHLNQGLLTTAIADTDTHKFFDLGTSGARTWTAAPADDPPSIDGGQVARAVAAGRAVLGQGIYLQAELLAGDDSGAVADLSLGGSTLVSTTNGRVELRVRVQAPTWAPYDRIAVYANAATTATVVDGGVPVLFDGVPTIALEAGEGFSVDTVDVFPAVPGAQRFETTVTIPFDDLTADTWFVVAARGTPGASRPMFPVMADDLSRETNAALADLLDGNLGEGGVTALGVTNALYADVDGVPGFQAPR